jgi:hypothetical protein
MRTPIDFEFKLMRCRDCGRFRFVENEVSEESYCTFCLRTMLGNSMREREKLHRVISGLRGTINRLKK